MTIFEAGPRLIPSADASISAALHGAFADRGMTVATGSLAEVLAPDRNGVAIDHRCDAAGGRTEAEAEQDHDSVVGIARYDDFAAAGPDGRGCMVAGLTVEQVAELQFAYPTCTEGVSMPAQMICRDIGIGRFPQAWSYLGADD